MDMARLNVEGGNMPSRHIMAENSIKVQGKKRVRKRKEIPIGESH